eukprot:ANDGO_05529.mRNA.1 hypothetical protein
MSCEDRVVRSVGTNVDLVSPKTLFYPTHEEFAIAPVASRTIVHYVSALSASASSISCYGDKGIVSVSMTSCQISSRVDVKHEGKKKGLEKLPYAHVALSRTGQAYINGREVVRGVSFVSACAGRKHILLLSADGKIWAAGDNSKSQFGVESSRVLQTRWRKPICVSDMSPILGAVKIMSIGVADSVSVFITTEGSVYGCGENGHLHLGHHTFAEQATTGSVISTPILLKEFPSPMGEVVMTPYHSVFISANRRQICCCGGNFFGEAISPHLKKWVSHPTVLDFEDDIREVVALRHLTQVFLQSGSIHTFGRRNLQELKSVALCGGGVADWTWYTSFINDIEQEQQTIRGISKTGDNANPKAVKVSFPGSLISWSCTSSGMHAAFVTQVSVYVPVPPHPYFNRLNLSRASNCSQSSDAAVDRHVHLVTCDDGEFEIDDLECKKSRELTAFLSLSEFRGNHQMHFPAFHCSSVKCLLSFFQPNVFWKVYNDAAQGGRLYSIEASGDDACVSIDNVFQVLELADMFNVPQLKFICEDILLLQLLNRIDGPFCKDELAEAAEIENTVVQVLRLYKCTQAAKYLQLREQGRMTKKHARATGRVKIIWEHFLHLLKIRKTR